MMQELVSMCWIFSRLMKQSWNFQGQVANMPSDEAQKVRRIAIQGSIGTEFVDFYFYLTVNRWIIIIVSHYMSKRLSMSLNARLTDKHIMDTMHNMQNITGKDIKFINRGSASLMTSLKSLVKGWKKFNLHENHPCMFYH